MDIIHVNDWHIRGDAIVAFHASEAQMLIKILFVGCSEVAKVHISDPVLFRKVVAQLREAMKD